MLLLRIERNVHAGLIVFVLNTQSETESSNASKIEMFFFKVTYYSEENRTQFHIQYQRAIQLFFNIVIIWSKKTTLYSDRTSWYSALNAAISHSCCTHITSAGRVIDSLETWQNLTMFFLWKLLCGCNFLIWRSLS